MYKCVKQIACLWIACLLLSLGAGAAIAAPEIAKLRIGDYDNRTRVVLDVSERLNFSAFILTDPYRVVIDIPESKWHSAPENALRGKRVSGYRFGLFRPGESRLVLDLKTPVKIARSFRLGPRKNRPHRLVFDLVPVSRDEMLAAIRQSTPRWVGKPAPTIPSVAKAVPRPEKPRLRTKQPSRPMIVIDPGHGGVDPGARGHSGKWEKHIVLRQARELRRQLLMTGRYRVHLTRDRDIFLRLRKRIAVAQQVKADLFLSLHADSIKNPRVRGASIYTLSEKASDKEARMLAEKENKADIIAGIDLNDKSKTVARILIDLRQRMTKNESVRFAKMLVSELQGKVPLLRKNRRFAGFAVLKAPDVPSVLIEMGYLSNRQDERLLSSRNHQRLFAASLVRAIDSYFRRQQALSAP